MTQPTASPEDAAMLRALGAVARAVDPIPEMTYELGHQVFSLLRVDDELAALVADSALTAGAVRSQTADLRLVSFEAGQLRIDLQVDHGRGSVLGMVEGLPAGASGEVYLETPEGDPRRTDLDGDGRFSFDAVLDSLARFRLVTSDSAVTTAWVHL